VSLQRNGVSCWDCGITCLLTLFTDFVGCGAPLVGVVKG